ASEPASTHPSSSSSCPALCRASTPYGLSTEGVDGRAKPGHDDRESSLRCAPCHASKRLNTTDALVPPKPNEFDSTQPSATLSRRSRTIGTSAKAGSSVWMFALSQMKPLFIIKSE